MTGPRARTDAGDGGSFEGRGQQLLAKLQGVHSEGYVLHKDGTTKQSQVHFENKISENVAIKLKTILTCKRGNEKDVWMFELKNGLHEVSVDIRVAVRDRPDANGPKFWFSALVEQKFSEILEDATRNAISDMERKLVPVAKDGVFRSLGSDPMDLHENVF